MFERRYENLRRGPDTDVPPTLIFVAGFAGGMWLNSVHPWLLDDERSLLLLTLGGVFIALGSALFAAGLLTFARARTGIMLQRAATLVVTTGPYRWSRNPQYVSFVLVHLGASLIANSVWPLLLLPVVILTLTRLVIAREERYLLRTFDTSYSAYTRRVPRWL